MTYLAGDYEQDLRNNIQFHGYKRLERVFRYILNRKIDVNSSKENQRVEKKNNNKKVYHTLKYMFQKVEEKKKPEKMNWSWEWETDECNESDTEMKSDTEIESDTEMDVDKDYEEEASDISDSEEETDTDDSISDNEIENIDTSLLEFTKNTLKPHGFDKYDGLGCFYGIRHPTHYYMFVPVFIRLQEFIHNENITVDANLRNFTVIPTYSYGLKHMQMHIDKRCLYNLFDYAGLNKRTDKNKGKKFSRESFTSDAEISNQLFDGLPKSQQFDFANRITTNGYDVSVLFTKKPSTTETAPPTTETAPSKKYKEVISIDPGVRNVYTAIRQIQENGKNIEKIDKMTPHDYYFIIGHKKTEKQRKEETEEFDDCIERQLEEYDSPYMNS